MHLIFVINSTHILYLALSGLLLLFHLYKRLMPFDNECRPFRAMTYAYCFIEQNVSIIAPKTSAVDTAHSLKNTPIQALKGRNSPRMDTVHSQRTTNIPALKGRHTSGMDTVHSGSSGMGIVHSGSFRFNKIQNTSPERA